MNEQQKMMAGAVLGIALIAAAIYYFFYKKSPVGADGKPVKPNTPSSPTPSGSTNTVQYVYTPAPAGTANANAVAYVNGQDSAVGRAIQNGINSCLISQITVDGSVGAITLAAIRNIKSGGKVEYANQIANEIQRTGYITKAQADWLSKLCGSDTLVASDPKPVPVVSGITIEQIKQNSSYATQYLANLGISTSGWWGKAVQEWAWAHKRGVPIFYCNECSTKKYYLTSNGSAAYTPLPAGTRFVDDLGGDVYIK